MKHYPTSREALVGTALAVATFIISNLLKWSL